MPSSDREYCKQWAADRKAVFEDHGEVGFGRPCVGIMRHDSYITTGYTYSAGEFAELSDRELFLPPVEVTDAYHKHECLAVLVYEDDYDEGIRQLAIWLRNLDTVGVDIESAPRTSSTFVELALHGTHEPVLVRR